MRSVPGGGTGSARATPFAAQSGAGQNWELLSGLGCAPELLDASSLCAAPYLMRTGEFSDEIPVRDDAPNFGYDPGAHVP